MIHTSSALCLGTVLVALLSSACADTNAPLPPAQELLLVVNSTANTLSIVPVEAPETATQVALGGTTPTPVGVSARKNIAIVPLGLDNAVAVVDLRAASVLRTIPLPANSGATGSVIVDDSIAYVANPNINSISRVNYLTGDTIQVAVGRYPQFIVFTRGQLFVMNGNLTEDLSGPAGPSWITVIDPTTNGQASGVDSIPLTGPGNAGFADLGGDGLIYVINTGSYAQGEGRLSIVDPLERRELASFSGFGTGPGSVASDGDSHIFVSSFSQGLMEFDTDSNKVLRGAGSGIPIPSNSAVAVDQEKRVYAIASGPCRGGRPGLAHVLSEALDSIRTIPLGECASGATVVSVPPEGVSTTD